MYTYIKTHGKYIFVRETGGIIKRVSSHKFRIFFESDAGEEYKNIEGRSLKYIEFDDFKSADKYVSSFRKNNSAILYGAKNFGYHYIRDCYNDKPPANVSDLFIANIDIETGRDDKGYSSPEDARCPITAITLEDMGKNLYYVWGWGDGVYIKEHSEIDVEKKYYHFSSEKDMLYHFVLFWSKKYPDIITGWNTDRYDIPYIINRIRNLFGDKGELLYDKLSPFNRVYIKTLTDQFGKEYKIYDIIGVSLLDYMVLFKKFTFKTPENYKLDTIAHMVLGERKLDYSDYANLQDLCDNNYQKFIDYNIKDVSIIHRLDNKLRLFELVLSLAYKAGINYTDVLSPVTTWDILIYNVLMDENIVPPINVSENNSGSYIGAYVKEPKPGLYKWVVSCDLNSLYPHLQMGINISPEKRLTDNELHPDLINIRKQLSDDTSIGIQKLLNCDIDTQLLKHHNVTIAPNGEFYRRDSDGFIPVILEKLYTERKRVKKSMLEDKQLMENDPLLDLTDQIASKDTLQMALKILMNSEYGALANKYFRYFNLKNAEAVTSSGQLAILWVANRLNIYLNRILKSNDVDYIIAIDTDSVYLNLESLVDKFIKTDDTDTIVEIISGWATKILEPEINKIYDDLADYINAHKQKMVMAREVIANVGFWTGKKRYALNVYDNEGVRYSKPKCKIMGLECVRSSTPEYIREKIKEGIKNILTKDENYFQLYMQKTEEDFFDRPYDDIAFPRGVNDIEKWNDNGIPKKSCPIAVRGAIVYNNFLSDNNLIDSERIQSGDKIKFVYLKTPNIFKSHVISYPPGLSKVVHHNIKLCVDYDKQWEGTFKKPIDMYCSCIGWNSNKKFSVFD